MSAPSKLGYWNCRGLAQPIRLLLEFVEESYEFVDMSYCNGPQKIPDKKIFRDNKYEILKGYDFPNMPFYEDGLVKLTHSMAIMQYLGRKHDLEPIAERTDLDLWREELYELLRLKTPSLCYVEMDKVTFVKEATEKINEIIRRLERNDGNFCIGKYISYVDFLLYELMDQWRTLIPGILDSTPKINEFINEFENLPTIKQYLISDRFKKFPLWSERSLFGRNAQNLP